MKENICNYSSVTENTSKKVECSPFLSLRYRDKETCNRCPKATGLNVWIFAKPKYSRGESAAFEIRKNQYRDK